MGTTRGRRETLKERERTDLELLGASLQLLERFGVKVGAGHGELSGWSETSSRRAVEERVGAHHSAVPAFLWLAWVGELLEALLRTGRATLRSSQLASSCSSSSRLLSP